LGERHGASHGREREGVDGLVLPFADQARNDCKPGVLQRTVCGELALEPFDVVRLARKEKDAVVAEKGVLVEASEIDDKGRTTEFDEFPEPSKCRWNEHRPERISDG
jgi:hypothetical protein